MSQPMPWTRNPPGKAGFYWYRVPRCAAIVLKVDIEFGVLVACFDPADQRVPVAALSGDAEWAGPIEPPVEADT